MSRYIKFLTLALISLAMSAPSADARGRNNGNNGNTSGAAHQSVPARQQTNVRPAQQHTSPSKSTARPAQPATARPASSQRPGGGPSVQPGSQRPGGGTTQRPGTQPGAQRPANGGSNGHGQHMQEHGHKPAAHPQPGFGHNYGPGPGAPAHHHHFGNVPPRPPYRPLMPIGRPYRPPMPPVNFRPGPHAPVINTILGITIGTALNMSLNYLVTNGFAVTGYSNDAVYLNNVNQLNLLWPNATLYYGPTGMLASSEFVYSTPYYDMNRYNTAYRYLTNAYGAPVSSMPLGGGGVQVSWFGYDGQFVSLQFMPANAYDGSFRYYTTLSFGR